MYIQKASIRNLRAIVELDWEVTSGEEAGWHVLLGSNGSGKSSLLKGLALALLGPREADGLRLDWDRWITRGRQDAAVDLELAVHPEDMGFAKGEIEPVERAGVTLSRSGDRAALGADSALHERLLLAGLWRGTPEGWLSVGYGPYRRFTGGDADAFQALASRPKLAAHLTLFGESYALTEAIRWLQELDYRRKEERPEGTLLTHLIEFVNSSELLPHGARLASISSDGVVFQDGNGCEVPVEELSDGYRSILSLTFELIRQLARCYGPEAVFDPSAPEQVAPPGVVLIDEVDVHLHPVWQHQIGTWFQRFFPRMQFIVTTHSPIVCQAAQTVWALPSPGASELPRRIEGQDLNRLRYGSILDAFGTGVFGEGVTRSEEGQKRLQRLAELNAKDLDLKLSPAEERERDELRESTPTAAARLPGMLKKVVP